MTAPEPAPEFDLSAHLAAIEQYQRDVNAAYEATAGGVDAPEWRQYCDELAEWNAAVQAERDRTDGEGDPLDQQ